MKYAATLILFCLGCQTAPQKIEEPQKLDARGRLEKIRSVYKTVDCFTTGFAVELVRPGTMSIGADGSLRVDNKNQKLRMYFTDQFLGITLSHATIRDKIVYVGSPRDPIVQVPVDQFVVGGLGNNTIRLPFVLFQDLLYGRVPEEVFSKKAVYSIVGDKLIVDYEDDVSRAKYEFTNDRLTSLDYYHKGERAHAQSTLTGTYGKTQFPLRIQLSGWTDGPVEKMNVTFTAVDLNAVCKDEYFPTRN